jgi:hypothetical protein
MPNISIEENEENGSGRIYTEENGRKIVRW